MASKDCFCINDAIFFWGGINVPQTNGMIIRSTEQITIQIWIPRKTIAFFLMTSKPENNKEILNLKLHTQFYWSTFHTKNSMFPQNLIHITIN